MKIQIHNLFISPEHAYFGRHGMEPVDAPMQSVTELECISGRGVVGDRFFDYRDDYKGQITFFDLAVHRELCQLHAKMYEPSSYRRNVMMSGLNLNWMIGQRFKIGDCEFEGIEHCKPCYWMDRACGDGAETFLQNRGGLRAKIINGGKLTLGKQEAWY